MGKKYRFVFYVCFFIIGVLSTLLYFSYRKETTVVNKVILNENGIVDGVSKIYDSVVVVESNGHGSSGVGSGFIYSKDGYILTNEHVVSSAKDVKVTFTNGNSMDAEVIGSDEYVDIAVLKINSNLINNVAEIGSSSDMKIGETVFAIGTPMNDKYYGTVTRGILSGKDRLVEVKVNSNSYDWIMNVLQTDTSLNPGNSGGPLCNINGEVIGVNTMKISDEEIDNIGFAIPIEEALMYAEKLINGEKLRNSNMGISMADLPLSSSNASKYDIKVDSKIENGVVVVESYDKGPASNAGIKKGDIIVELGTYEINSIAELKYYLSKYNPGEKVNVKIIRGNETKTMNVLLSESE